MHGLSIQKLAAFLAIVSHFCSLDAARKFENRKFGDFRKCYHLTNKPHICACMLGRCPTTEKPSSSSVPAIPLRRLDSSQIPTNSIPLSTTRIQAFTESAKYSLSTSTSTMYPDTESSTLLARFFERKTKIPDSESLPLEYIPDGTTIGTKLLISEVSSLEIFPPFATESSKLPSSESSSNEFLPSFATTSTKLPGSESSLEIFPAFATESSKLPSSESSSKEFRLPFPTTNTKLPGSESSLEIFPAFATESSKLPSSESSSKEFRLPFPTKNTKLPGSESSLDIFPPFATESSKLPSSESSSNEFRPPFPTTNTKLPGSELSSLEFLLPFTTTNKKLFYSESNTFLPSSTTTNTILPDSGSGPSCPDNYCMQNAECIVVKGQYRCKCPSSFVGELCEIELKAKSRYQEYAVAIVISLVLLIFCSAVLSVCIYRYKRTSAAWKSNDMTSRTFSQLTLTSYDGE